MMVAKLLQSDAVREDLGISRETAQEAMAAIRELRTRLEPEMRGMMMMAPETRAAAMAEFNSKIADSVEGAFSLILDDSQLARFKQILLQSKGLEAFTLPDTQSRLNLDTRQLDELREIFVQTSSQAKEITTAARESGNREDGLAQLAAFRREAMEKALAVLDDSQTAIWKEMTGERFEFKMQPSAMGGPGMMGRRGMGGPGMMGRPGMGGPGMGKGGMGGPGMMGKGGMGKGGGPLGGDDDLF